MPELTADAVLFALLLFTMRVINYAISTIRLVFIARDLRLLSAVTAFLEALIFAVVMASVVNDLSNLLNLGAYCFGAAAGSYLGQWLESRFVVSYSTVTIITREQGREIVEALRSANFGVTVTKGEGRDGEVDIIRSSSINRDIPGLIRIVRSISETAFVDVEAARTMSRGWIPGGPPRRV
ncbi:MAG: hypothetical protein KC496_11395 [Anaerolineae bacterium]|nr:hypothetical protein [Anaerolineae bacterium]